MAKQKKAKKHHRKNTSIMSRSDIPFSQRMQYQRISDIKKIRDYSAKITMFCISIALHKLEGIGYKRLVRFSLHFKELIDEFYEDVEVGMYRAARRMEQLGMPISGEFQYVRVPEFNRRKQEQYNNALESSQAAQICGTIAINDVFGLGQGKLQNISQMVQELTQRYASEGDGFLFEEMQNIGFPVIDGKVIACLDDNDNPITYKKWLEGQSNGLPS